MEKIHFRATNLGKFQLKINIFVKLMKKMKILVTNDDGYDSLGIKTLVNILKSYGEITVVGPKYHQSGMSMAVNLGYKPMAVKKLSEEPGERWYYMDATPSSCVKYGIDNIFYPDRPDIVFSGINHGLNAAMCSPYSGTIGAAKEAALGRIPSIAVSLDTFRKDADFSAVEELLPSILEPLLDNMETRFGMFYNINFPDLPAEEIKGVRVCHLGRMHWEREFMPFDPGFYEKTGVRPLEDLGVTWLPKPEPGEEVFAMVGDMINDSDSPADSDQLLLKEGYITITPENLDDTDVAEKQRLRTLGFETDF